MTGWLIITIPDLKTAAHGQATGGTFNSHDDRLGFCGVTGDVLDVALKVMALDNFVLGDKMKCEGDWLLAQIGRADSMIVAVQAGARAEGFVLGLETAGAFRAGDAERLYSFSKRLWKTTSKRWRLRTVPHLGAAPRSAVSEIGLGSEHYQWPGRP